MGKQDKDKKGKPLTGLAAALVKAGHLSEKKAKELSREQRREDKALGRDGVAEREVTRQEAVEAERAAEAAAAREREQRRLAEEAQQRAERLVRTNAAADLGGGRRWFFVARDRRVLFVDVADDVAGLLASGGAGIVESLGQSAGEHVVVVGEKPLLALQTIDSDLVRFWNKP